jgi:hypothetical protein
MSTWDESFEKGKLNSQIKTKEQTARATSQSPHHYWPGRQSEPAEGKLGTKMKQFEYQKQDRREEQREEEQTSQLRNF